MGEIMRWRLARSAQRRIPADVDLLQLDGGGTYQISSDALTRLQSLQAGPDGNSYAGYVQLLTDVASVKRYLTMISPANAPARPAAPPPVAPPPPGVLSAQVINAFIALVQLDRWLASVGDKPTVAQLTTEVNGLLSTVLGTASWITVHTILNELFYAALILSAYGVPFSLTEVLGWLCRMILVVGVVDLLELIPSPLLQPDDVYRALRWRTPILPDAVALILTALRLRNQAILVRKPGFADLYITREEWDRYESAEIASIENILAHESKSHVHVLVNRTQTSTTVDTSTTSVKEQDTTTTDLTQLQQQSSSDITIAAHVDGQVDTSGQYGPTQVNTHLGGSLDYSNASATSKSITQSHETVSRAVNKVEKTTRQIRTVSTLTESVDKEKHTFNNQSDKDVIGIYRWVDQIQNVELDRYPHRFLMEFEVPEPGAWTRWLHLNDVSRTMVNQLPPPLTGTGNPGDPPLTPDQLSDPQIGLGPGIYDYRAFVARYNVQGVSPPPTPTRVVAVNLSYPTSGTDPKTDKVLDRFLSDSTLAIPDGYTAWQWVAEGSSVFSDAGLDGHEGEFESDFQITVGGGAPVGIQTVNGLITMAAGHPAGAVSDGNIPVAVTAELSEGFELNIAVTCIATQGAFEQWQTDTYAQISAAYNALVQAYNDEKAGLAVQTSNPVNLNSPAQNADSIKQELKRQVIEMLTGTPFSGSNAINWDGINAPTTQLPNAARYAPEIQFLEQAFEWETLSYICYPYYWADSSRWGDLARIEGNDPDFASFLRAGSARVVLAARPGFEDQVNFYVNYGILWGGGPMPAPGDENYLSIADEIKAQQQRPLDVSVIDAWQVRLPTTLIWLENKDGLPPNPSPTILVVTKIFPSSGNIGDSVSIYGSNFGPTPGTSSVTFNGTVAVPTNWSNHSITVPVPANATTGNVVVQVNGLTSNGVMFVIGASPDVAPPLAPRAIAPPPAPRAIAVPAAGMLPVRRRRKVARARKAKRRG